MDEYRRCMGMGFESSIAVECVSHPDAVIVVLILSEIGLS